jgi:hypothetical protein
MRTTSFLLFIIVLISCNNKQDVPAGNEPKNTNNKKEEVNPPNHSDMDVDTSLAGILLYDSASFASVAGLNNHFCFGETYCFNSLKKDEVLRLTMHPGSNAFSVSEFEAGAADVTYKNAKVLNIEHFTSGKGVKLGMSKQDIINLFGNNYKAEDSSNSFIRLNYRIETPDDTKTRILQRYNMPIYYSIYEFRDDKLEHFKFGFEYP